MDAELAPLFALLSRVFLQEADEELLTALREPGAGVLLRRLEPGWNAWVEAPWTEARAEEAREEYARLFLLPGGVPPFASAWLEGERERLGSQLSTLVQHVMRALGREPRYAEPWGNVPLDHLGLLLELVGVAASAPQPERRELADHLLREAVEPWIASFSAALATKAKLPLYVAAARLLQSLLGAK